MTNIFLQPFGNDVAYENFEETILKPISINQYKDLIDQNDYEILKRIYPDGMAQVWGITPGKNNVNVSKWQHLMPGDITLFYREGVYELSAVTTYTLRNPDLSLKLWGIDDKNQTWEYMYFLAETKKIHLPKEELNALVGYSENNFPQGFARIKKCSEEQRLAILDNLNLISQVHYPEVDSDLINKLKKILDSDEDLDKSSLAKRRVEQGILRSLLFNQRPTFTCSICQREYLTKFLVAAHIKKRSKCTKEERLDVENIVAPMCKFGCDDLYEHGYIGVDNGIVKILNSKATKPMLQYMKEIEGNVCSYWNPNTEPYFKWHIDLNTSQKDI